MENLLAILFLLAFLWLIVYYILGKKKKSPALPPITDKFRAILEDTVEFYSQLPLEKRKEFQHRIQLFLAQTRITGVNTTVEDMDKILIASSAVIPIFGFPGWEYVNLREVLLYPDHFNYDFEQTGSDRNILGMVGTGPMNGTMILSQRELRQAFMNNTGTSNVGIHEFVHLVDKMDGETDGVPSFIAQRQYLVPWLKLMREEMKRIIDNESDINPYGATSEKEFFAVVAEYFFEKPDQLQEKHPELYDLLSNIFQQKPTKQSSS